MKYKKSLLILITAIFLVSVAGVCASDANDTAIASDDSNQMELSSDSEISEDDLQTGEENSILTQNDDETVSAESDSQTLGAGEGTFSDLRNEIGNGGDKNLSKSYYRYNSGNAIQIKTPGVINGNGAIIDMAGATIRAFYVTVSNVTIKDLTIKNANCSAGGGAAIYFTSSGTVENCNFINNTAGDNGGAVNFAESGTVTNCNFTNNTAGNNAGALFQGNAYNCVFIGNRADGGGAMSEGFAFNCRFIENYADGFGGAINGYNQKLINCTFTSNYAGRGGGAISGGEAYNCTFISNVARQNGGAINDCMIYNCNFTNNKVTSSYAYGGAVYYGSNGNVANCTFANNKVTSSFSRGGAVYFNGNGNVANCNFTGNEATTNGIGGAVYFNGNGNVTNCNFTGNEASIDGGAVCFNAKGNVTNCNFTNNHIDSAHGTGGAICFGWYGNGTVTNCNFTNNCINGGYGNGGAIGLNQYSNGIFENCNFANNKANGEFGRGGAIFTNGNGFAIAVNCNFVDNQADSQGGAIYLDSGGNLTNCIFINNQANNGGAISGNGVADTCVFKAASDSIQYTQILSPTLDADNFITAYDSGEKLTFDLKTNGSMPVENGNILISIYYKDNGSWFGNYSCLSGEGWVVNLPAGYYYAIYGTEYYGSTPITRIIKIDKISSDMNVSYVSLDYGNSTSVSVETNGAIGITAKIDDDNATVMGNTIMIPSLDAGTYILAVTTIPDSNHTEVTKFAKITVNKLNTQLAADSITVVYNIGGDLTVTLKDVRGNPLANQELLVYFNGAKTFDLTDLNGTIKVPVKGLAANTYGAEIVFKGNDNYNASNAVVTVTVNKDTTSLSADAVTAVYNANKNLVITLKDSRGNPIKGAVVTVDLNGVKTYNTDSNGQIKVATKGLAAKAYTAKITFNGNANYDISAKDVKVTVKKATPILTAKKATLKAKTKTKKYAVTLKDNVGKAMNKVQVSLKVKGKTYKATTNAKGKATFKIKKLTKKGTYKATVTFKGNGNYNKITKTVKINVK